MKSVLSFLLVITIFGCGPSGPKIYPVKGTVKVAGKPANAALVFMHREGRNALTDPVPYGTCTEQGVFEIETPSIGKGAQEGKYMLTVYWPDMNKPEDGNGQRPDALNGAYERVDQSKLTFEVKPGPNEIPVLELTPGQPKRTQPDPNLK